MDDPARRPRPRQRQCADLKCNGRYSDDYARDAAEGFGKGEIRSPLAFAQRIVESPTGWWCGSDGAGRVSVSCFHFDSNSFRLDLHARPALSPNGGDC